MREENDIVSVCMITYNHEDYISEAIEGVLSQQTNFPYKLIIGEDNSTDKTREICLEFQARHPEVIELLPNEGNLGMMPNFIRTLEACNGKYIALCEGDDYWTDPSKLQKQFDFLETHEQYIACFHNALKSDEQLFHDSHFYGRYSIKDIFRNWLIPTAALMFRNNLLTKDDFQFLQGQLHGDYSLAFMLMQYGETYCLPDSIYSYYRLHGGGVSNSFRKRGIIMTMSHDMVRMKMVRNDLGELFEKRLLGLIEKTQEDILLLNRTSTFKLFKILLNRITSKIHF